MKKGIHPIQSECQVTCACGNKFKVKSTLKEMNLESCSKCHSFYTGKHMTARAGKVQKFNEKYGYNQNEEK